MSTKAVHLELCADLTTPEFMAALHRFCNRRGTPADIIYSDNGTNFQGANHKLDEVRQLMTSKSTSTAISHFTTTTSVQWHFTPPRTPHFGGLWEAGVKSMKTVLRKIVNPHPLMFQELTTILTEVEAVLNSRPLTSVHSTDIDAPPVLTTGHFLIGCPLKALPVRDAKDFVNIPVCRRWNLVQRIREDLWTAWSSSYLQSLHARSKVATPH